MGFVILGFSLSLLLIPDFFVLFTYIYIFSSSNIHSFQIVGNVQARCARYEEGVVFGIIGSKSARASTVAVLCEVRVTMTLLKAVLMGRVSCTLVPTTMVEPLVGLPVACRYTSGERWSRTCVLNVNAMYMLMKIGGLECAWKLHG